MQVHPAQEHSAGQVEQAEGQPQPVVAQGLRQPPHRQWFGGAAAELWLWSLNQRNIELTELSS